jgi:hypothetical protein
MALVGLCERGVPCFREVGLLDQVGVWMPLLKHAPAGWTVELGWVSSKFDDGLVSLAFLGCLCGLCAATTVANVRDGMRC